MKLFALMILVAAFLTATVPCQAEGTLPLPAASHAPTPHFITRGQPLTVQEITGLSQRIIILGHISRDAGGDGDDDIPKADAIFMGIVVIAAIGGLIYLVILETQQANKLF